MSEESLFQRALELPPAERPAFLEKECRADDGLRNRLQTLLEAHDNPGSFLHGVAPAMHTLAESGAEGPGMVIGPYKLRQHIGEGGMGVVYMAEQQEPVRRMVALKIIKLGMDSNQVIARFEAERQALAMMDHPNIAKVHDAGTTATGRPYFVMELVKGIPITKFCDENQLAPRERLKLFVFVCQAVQHAHTKGIIHRDLKPSNVLVALYDDKPVPKVIDFGVAKATGEKLTDRSMFTGFGAFVGTLEYMSPEQAKLNALDIDARSDVYALGVLLYELLTGSTPLEKERLKQTALDELLRVIREEEPPRPSARLTTSDEALALSARRGTEPARLSKVLRGELDWIVMKALDKDRTRRYETANGFARDIEHYLNEEPVEACPPSAWYRVRKIARRNKAAVTTAALVAATLVLGIVGTTLGLLRAVDAEADAIAARDQEAEQRLAAEAQRNRAVMAEAEAKKNELLAKDNEMKAEASATLAIKGGQLAREHAKIAEEERLKADVARQKAEDNETKAEWRLYGSHIASAQVEWGAHNLPLFYHFLKQSRRDFRGWEHDYLYSLGNQNSLTLQGHANSVWSVAISPDGKWLASATGGLNLGEITQLGEVKLWDIASRRETRALPAHKARCVAFSPDGKMLVTWGWTGVFFWDVVTGKEIQPSKSPLSKGKGFKSTIAGVAVSMNGKYLASAGKGGEVKLWETASGQELQVLKGYTGTITTVAFSPDGKRLAAAGGRIPGIGNSEAEIKLWDVGSGEEITTFLGKKISLGNLAFSPDGKYLAGTADKLLKILDATTGEPVLTLEGHGETVRSLAYSPDGKHLASSSDDKTVKVWDAVTGREIRTLTGHTGQVFGITFSPDGNHLVSASKDKTIKIWTLSGTQESMITKTLKGQLGKVNFSPDGQRLASAAQENSVKLWDATSGAEQLMLQGHTDKLISVAFSPDGKRLASTARDKTMRLWDAGNGKELNMFSQNDYAMMSLSFSPDSKCLAGASGQVVRVFDAASGQRLLELKGHSGQVRDVSFSPNGKQLASASRDRTVRIWNLADGQALLTLRASREEDGMASPVDAAVLAFSPDGKRIAGALAANTVKVWDTADGKEVLTLEGHTGQVLGVAFTPDGKRLATASQDNTVRIWDLVSGQEVLTLKGPPGYVGQSLRFHPDGKSLASAGAREMNSPTLKTGEPTTSMLKKGQEKLIIYDASKSMKELEQK